MAQRTVTIGSSVGPARPPGRRCSSRRPPPPASRDIARDGEDPPSYADSILGVMALGARHGEEVVLQADGDGADEALDRLAALLSHDLDARVTRRPSTEASARHRRQPGTAYGPVVQVAPPVRPPAGEPAAADRRGGALADVRGGLRVGRRRARAAGAAGRRHRAADPQGHRAHRPRQGAGQGRRQAARRRPRPGHRHRQRRRGLTAPSSRRPAATSPSGSPTCATSATGPSPRCSGVPEPGLPDFGRAERHRRRRPRAGRDRDPRPRPRRRRSSPRRAARTSHTAILAAQLGIPAVVQLAGATGSPTARRSPLDGDTGEVTSTPTRPSPRRADRAGRATRRGAVAPSSGPGRTRDGARRGAAGQHRRRRRTPNAAGAPDLEGVGLFRTELLFLVGRQGTRPSTSRPRSTARCSSRSATAAWSSAPWTPAPTSRWPSPTSGRRRTRPSGVAGCACRPSVPTCSTPSSRRSPRPPGPPAPTCGSWRRWWPPPRRPRGSPGGSARTACPSAGVMIEVPAAALRARARARPRSTSAASAPTTWRSTPWPPTGCWASSRDLLDPWQPAVLDLIAARVRGGAAARPPHRRLRRGRRRPAAGPGARPASASRACRWHHRRCPRSATPSRCTTSPPAPGWPPSRAAPPCPSRAAEAVAALASPDLLTLL